jgi:hypothetical protein
VSKFCAFVLVKQVYRALLSGSLFVGEEPCGVLHRRGGWGGEQAAEVRRLPSVAQATCPLRCRCLYFCTSKAIKASTWTAFVSDETEDYGAGHLRLFTTQFTCFTGAIVIIPHLLQLSVVRKRAHSEEDELARSASGFSFVLLCLVKNVPLC